MPYVVLSKEAEAAVRSLAEGDISDWSGPRADGQYDVWLSHEVLGAILSSMFVGETISDTVYRLCTLQGKKVN